MNKTFVAAVAASISFSAPAPAQTTYNATPFNGFSYGSGNDYSPANAVVNFGSNGEAALRFHQTYEVAPESNAGIYSFALGTTPLSFDWYLEPFSFSLAGSDALITLTNLGTGQTFSYNPLFSGNDNYFSGGSYQNSFRLNWVPIGFDPSVNGLYSATLTGGGTTSATAYARLGSGLISAVPEPDTWAMMLLGFGAIGFALRRRRRHPAIARTAYRS